MPAPKGNKNAVKYDPNKVAELINQFVNARVEEGRTPFIEEVEDFFEYREPGHIPKGTYLTDFAKEHKVVSEAFDRLKRMQKAILAHNGLSGSFNATITKLLLNVNHGMVELSKKETDLTSKGEKISFGLAELVKANEDQTETESE